METLTNPYAAVEDEDYLNIENAADKDDQTTDENADEMSEGESEEEAKDMEDSNSTSAVEQEKLARKDRDGKLRANRLRHTKIQERILIRATMDALHAKALSDKDLKPYVMQEVPGGSFVLHGIERGKTIFKLDRAKGIYWIRKNQSIKDPTKGDFIQTTGRLSNDPRDAEYPTLYKSLKNPRHLAIEYAEKLQKLVDTEEDSETSEDEYDAESDSEDDDDDDDDDEEEGEEEEEEKEKEGSET
ncbi:MAG: hypothetical protein M1821_000114 [Bathelium mastoideum]|nr:MAG: hypothetical protein M1821_000114 [Bathelium mastoideum]